MLCRPSFVTELPTIRSDDGTLHIGNDECVIFYERLSGLTDLLATALVFKEGNPVYRMHR